MEQTEYQNQFHRAQGIANSRMGSAKFHTAENDKNVQQAGNIAGSAIQFGGAAAGVPLPNPWGGGMTQTAEGGGGFGLTDEQDPEKEALRRLSRRGL